MSKEGELVPVDRDKFPNLELDWVMKWPTGYVAFCELADNSLCKLFYLGKMTPQGWFPLYRLVVKGESELVGGKGLRYFWNKKPPYNCHSCNFRRRVEEEEREWE